MDKFIKIFYTTAIPKFLYFFVFFRYRFGERFYRILPRGIPPPTGEERFIAIDGIVLTSNNTGNSPAGQAGFESVYGIYNVRGSAGAAGENNINFNNKNFNVTILCGSSWSSEKTLIYKFLA